MHYWMRRLAAPLVFALMACASRSTIAAAPAIVLAPGVELFEFHSDFWLNLHHFLYWQSRTRRGFKDSQRPAVAAVATDTAGIGRLSDDERRGWERAVAYYDTALAARAIDFDSAMIDLNYQLAGIGAAPLDTVRGLSPGVRAALEAAAPAYRAVWWPRHESANRAWVTALTPLLRQYGKRIANQMERTYEVRWPAQPMHVEVVAYANWAGAYTTFGPPLLTLSSLYRGHRGTLGLEQVFHEASHTMMDSVDAELKRVGISPGQDRGREISHAVLFYTIGEILRRTVPGHTPFAEWRKLWAIPRWAQYHERLVTDWQPYLDGRDTFQHALDAFASGF